jgi:hypothetical protein
MAFNKESTRTPQIYLFFKNLFYTLFPENYLSFNCPKEQTNKISSGPMECWTKKVTMKQINSTQLKIDNLKKITTTTPSNVKSFSYVPPRLVKLLKSPLL